MVIIMKKIGDAEQETIITDYQAGKTLQEIANRLSVTAPAVLRHLQNANIPRRPRGNAKFTSEQWRKIIEEAETTSQVEASAKYKVSEVSLRYWKRKFKKAAAPIITSEEQKA